MVWYSVVWDWPRYILLKSPGCWDVLARFSLVLAFWECTCEVDWMLGMGGGRAKL